MIKLKKWRWLAGVAVLLTLSACGQRLSVAKTNYEQVNVVAVIKGKAANHKRVSYQTATAQGKVKVHNGRFRIAVPTATHRQTMTVKVGHQTIKRSLKAVPALGAYSQIAAKYNQALAVAALPQPLQAQLKATTTLKTKPTGMAPAQQLAMMQAETKLKAAMSQAQAKIKSQQFPKSVRGQRSVLKTTTSSAHLNVQQGQLMSATIAMTPQALKNRQAQKRLGLQLGLLATALGANAQQVGHQFQQIVATGKLKKQTITDHGVKFQVGTTLSEAYLFVTR